MKVAVIENERREIEGAFDYANFRYFDNALALTYFDTSQQFLAVSNLDEFSLILVDIDLSKQSELDGYALIRLLLERAPQLKDRILILTGHSKIEERLSEKMLPPFPIIPKPADFNKIHSLFKLKGL